MTDEQREPSQNVFKKKRPGADAEDEQPLDLEEIMKDMDEPINLVNADNRQEMNSTYFKM